MDPESKELLKATLELSQENNNMLRSMKRSMQMSRVMSSIYWLFIIGSAVGAYYYIQPYIDQVLDVYSGASDKVNSINDTIEEFKNLGL